MPKSTINLTPSEAMAAAAKRGLQLAENRTPDIFEAPAKARARKISENQPLTAAEVKRLSEFFERNLDQRTGNWGLEGQETDAFVAHLMRGGDAGKPWAKARLKELGDIKLSDDEAVQFYEMFLSDAPQCSVDSSGLVWKPMLRTGFWEVGPNGKPIRVISGRSPDQRTAIGLQDIKDAFDAGAIEHVTVPLSHDDRVDENAGFVKQIKMHNSKDGTVWLMGAHKFTEPDIEGKVKRGTIPNSSVGLEFDYQQKETGRRWPVVLRHNALTGRPWINRLTPFGVQASDDIEYEIMSFQFSEPLKPDDDRIDMSWDNALTFDEIRDAIDALIDDGEVVQIAFDRALIKSKDKQYVARFSIDDGAVKIEDRDSWIERETPTSTEDPDDDKSPGNIPPKPSSPKEPTVPATPDPTKTDPTPVPPAPVTPPVPTPAPVVPPVPEGVTKAQFDEQQEEIVRLKAQNDQLAAESRERKADDIVSKLKKLGFDEEHGCTALLKRVRNIFLADKGEAVLNLAEGDDETPKPFTAAQLVAALFEDLPTDDKTGKLKVQLAEQQSTVPGTPPKTPDPTKPPTDAAATTPASKEEVDLLFSEMFPEQGASLVPANKE